MKCAEYTGPSRKADALALQTAIDKAYGLPWYAVKRGGGQGALIEHWTDVMVNEQDDVAAVCVPVDGDTGNAFVKPEVSLKPAELTVLSVAVTKQSGADEWDPTKPASELVEGPAPIG